MSDKDEYGRASLGKRDEPHKALIYFEGTNSYQANVWYSRSTGLNRPVICYTYWIWIIDNDFDNRTIKDSAEDDTKWLDIIFEEKSGILDVKGFMFKHFAGPIFRVKFELDSNTYKIKKQDLII
jgi:hypothetical protein